MSKVTLIKVKKKNFNTHYYKTNIQSLGITNIFTKSMLNKIKKICVINLIKSVVTREELFISAFERVNNFVLK